MKRKDSQDISISRKRNSQDMFQIGSRKRGSQGSKCGSQSRSPIEESPEHEPCVDVIAEEVKETNNATSIKVQFFSISLKLSPDKSKIKKLRNGTPPIKKADTVTFAVCVEPNQRSLSPKKKDQANENGEENDKTVKEINNKDEQIIVIPVTKV